MATRTRSTSDERWKMPLAVGYNFRDAGWAAAYVRSCQFPLAALDVPFDEFRNEVRHFQVRGLPSTMAELKQRTGR